MNHINIYTAMVFTSTLVLAVAVVYIWVKYAEITGSWLPFI